MMRTGPRLLSTLVVLLLIITGCVSQDQGPAQPGPSSDTTAFGGNATTTNSPYVPPSTSTGTPTSIERPLKGCARAHGTATSLGNETKSWNNATAQGASRAPRAVTPNWTHVNSTGFVAFRVTAGPLDPPASVEALHLSEDGIVAKQVADGSRRIEAHIELLETDAATQRPQNPHLDLWANQTIPSGTYLIDICYQRTSGYQRTVEETTHLYTNITIPGAN